MLMQTRNIIDIIPLLQELEFGDKFSLSMLHWCGIGQRAYSLAFWEVYIVKANEETIGVIGLYRQVHTPIGVAWIGWFGVRPSFRDRGLGTQMLRDLVKIAKEYKFKELWVFTDRENRGALRFYEQFGFINLGTVEENDPGVTHDPTDVVLKYSLDSSPN
jgi:RimJ/RimL family protein N-acetyltransferase